MEKLALSLGAGDPPRPTHGRRRVPSARAPQLETDPARISICPLPRPLPRPASFPCTSLHSGAVRAARDRGDRAARQKRVNPRWLAKYAKGRMERAKGLEPSTFSLGS